MSVRFARALWLVVGVPFVTVVFASSASGGELWYSSSSPLKVYDDGVAQGKAYGNFYNSQNTYAKNKATYADLRPGGDAVRVETDFYFYEYDGVECGSQGTCFVFSASKQTDPTTSSSWKTHTRARTLSSRGSRARGRIDICEIQAWSNDPCSAKPIPTFAY